MTKTEKTPPKRPSLTDAERHKRFTDMAVEVGADQDPAAFERAFANVVAPPKPAPEKSK